MSVNIGRTSDKFVGGIVGILLTIAVGGMVVLYLNRNQILPGNDKKMIFNKRN